MVQKVLITAGPRAAVSSVGSPQIQGAIARSAHGVESGGNRPAHEGGKNDQRIANAKQTTRQVFQAARTKVHAKRNGQKPKKGKERQK